VRKPVTILILALLFACSRKESVAQSEASPSPASVDKAVTETLGVASAGATAPAATRQDLPRMIVRTADVRIVVADTTRAVAAVTKSVEGAGGYVSGSNVWREGELLRAKLTLRVPAAQLMATLGAIRGLAKRVESETITSEDVTQEYVDLGSQLKNLEATEVELRELLTSVRQSARKAADVLEVHQQLTAIRGEIERTKGRMRYLGQVTSMSTVTLDVIPDAIAAPVVEPGWQPVVVVKNASRSLIGTLQTLVEIAIWFVIYVLPVLGIIALAVFVLWKGLRRLKARQA
jgi:hypothetical protein